MLYNTNIDIDRNISTRVQSARVSKPARALVKIPVIRPGHVREGGIHYVSHF